MLSSLRKIYHITDYTSLNSTDTPEGIDAFCKSALKISEEHGIAGPASICVYPLLVRSAKDVLRNTNIKIASVAGFFPSGLAPLKLKLDEIEYALNEGADEIDFVINRANLIMDDYESLTKEIKYARKACGSACLKIILETGELNNYQIERSSMICLEKGADFIKTSTGKINTGATIEASEIMLKQLRLYYENTGIMKGFKASGGIRDSETAFQYYDLVSSMLGEKFLNPDHFRIGASGLISNMLSEL